MNMKSTCDLRKCIHNLGLNYEHYTIKTNRNMTVTCGSNFVICVSVPCFLKKIYTKIRLTFIAMAITVVHGLHLQLASAI